MKDDTYCNEARGDRFVAYLYDDLDSSGRAEMDAHLAACESCRAELAAFRSLRRELGRWALPEPSAGFTPGMAPAPGRLSLWARLTAVPAWAQAAAAVLVVGAAAGLANLEIQYDAGGLAVRTGWLRPAQAAVAPDESAAPWDADLEALAAELRGELDATRAEVRPVATTAVNAERVQGLIDDSERRHQREMALRLAELARDLQAQRRGDLEKIQYSLGMMESNLGTMQNIGVEVMRQRQMINDLAVPASQRR